jgi:hypothetical protein
MQSRESRSNPITRKGFFLDNVDQFLYSILAVLMGLVETEEESCIKRDW